MPPFLFHLLRRKLNPGVPSSEFSQQWTNPGFVFSVLLILGGDVIGRALAQLVGSPVTPVAFSFGWVAFAITAVVSAIGENKLMPLPDCTCKVINGRTGYVRDNSSWIIGRIVRDFETWMDPAVRKELDDMLREKWITDKKRAEDRGSGERVPKPSRGGLCVSIYEAKEARPGFPGVDFSYCIGFVTIFMQLGIAAIPCGISGDWSVLLVTASGTLLSFTTGWLPQWSKEKWACRLNSEKKFILTRGNGSQHAIVILGNHKGLDLEDLATGPSNTDVSASYITKIAIIILGVLWILLLITATGIQQNTWFLLAVGSIGILQNMLVAGRSRFPKDFGVPLQFKEVICRPKVMDTLFAVEAVHPYVGSAMLPTFFPDKLRPDERKKWDELERIRDGSDGSSTTQYHDDNAQPNSSHTHDKEANVQSNHSNREVAQQPQCHQVAP